MEPDIYFEPSLSSYKYGKVIVEYESFFAY